MPDFIKFQHSENGEMLAQIRFNRVIHKLGPNGFEKVADPYFELHNAESLFEHGIDIDDLREKFFGGPACPLDNWISVSKSKPAAERAKAEIQQSRALS